MPNINLLKQSINDAYRYARQGDSRAFKSYQNFLSEAIENPGPGSFYEFKAKKDCIKYFDKFVNSGENTRLQYLKRRAITARNMLIVKTNQMNAELVEAFNDNYKTFYPKTRKIRHKLLKHMFKDH